MVNITDHHESFNCSQLPGYVQTFERSDAYECTLLILLIINSITALVVACSNLVVGYTIIKTTSLHTPSNYLIFGLALSDLCVGIISQSAFSAIQYYELIELTEPYCIAAALLQFSGWTLGTISLLTLTALTTDRFFALHFHLRYQEMMTCPRVAVVLVIIWVYGMMAGVFRILTQDNVFLIHIIMLILVVLLDIYFLLRINQTVRRHSAQIQAQQATHSMNRRMKKSMNAMYYVIGAFVLCYFPYIGCILTIGIVGKWNEKIRISFRAAELFALLNSLLNPIIYCWRIEELRNAARHLLRRTLNLNDSSEG